MFWSVLKSHVLDTKKDAFLDSLFFFSISDAYCKKFSFTNCCMHESFKLIREKLSKDMYAMKVDQVYQT